MIGPDADGPPIGSWAVAPDGTAFRIESPPFHDRGSRWAWARAWWPDGRPLPRLGGRHRRCLESATPAGPPPGAPAWPRTVPDGYAEALKDHMLGRMDRDDAK